MNWNGDTIRELERESILNFVALAAANISGHVLDVGCGKQPYRGVFEEAGCTYFGLDHPRFPGSTVEEEVGDMRMLLDEQWDAILCTQVVQYVPSAFDFLITLYHGLRLGGRLVITWPTCWDEVEAEDRWRFTQAGMTKLLTDVGFYVLGTQRRAELQFGGFRFCLGGGAVALK